MAVCVIGAGSSGLPAIKSCLEEGLRVTCFEQSQYIGGLWRFRNNVEEDSNSVFINVVQNTAKECIAYSDYPPPPDYSVYVRHSIYYEYLKSYVEHFELKKHIRFQHKVLEVVRSQDYDSTGRWEVKVLSIEDNEVRTEYFDFVMICSGHHTYPIQPKYPGEDSFQGKIMHSKEYKTPDPFRGLNVVVVGFGNSAVDISTDISSTTKQTYLSTRHKGWVLPRFVDGKKVLSHALFPKWMITLDDLLPKSYMASRYEKLANKAFDHKACGLQPEHSIMSQRPVVSDLLPLYLMNGIVKLKRGIKELKPNGLVFEGESEVTEADVLIYATGYKAVFPFLKGMEDADDYMDSLYRLVFPIKLKQSTLAFIGLLDPNVPTPVLSELQSRWVARIFAGKLKLPRRELMLAKAHEYQEMLTRVCYEGFNQKTNIHGPPYLDEIARDLGVMPSYLKLLLTDPRLFFAVFFGPLSGYHYRIRGPNSWSGARKAILDLERNLQFGVQQSSPSVKKSSGGKKTIFVLGLLCAIGIGLGCQIASKRPGGLTEIFHRYCKVPSS